MQFTTAIVHSHGTCMYCSHSTCTNYGHSTCMWYGQSTDSAYVPGLRVRGHPLRRYGPCAPQVGLGFLMKLGFSHLPCAMVGDSADGPNKYAPDLHAAKTTQ